MGDEVTVNEAWYICPIHGEVHYPFGPNTEPPCPTCATCLDAMGPFESIRECYEEMGEGDRFRELMAKHGLKD